jgi:hypothetical protein
VLAQAPGDIAAGETSADHQRSPASFPVGHG